MRLADINWGDDSAEKDPQLLQYFVSSSAFERGKQKRKNIIVGRKGSGKSALRKPLTITSMRKIAPMLSTSRRSTTQSKAYSTTKTLRLGSVKKPFSCIPGFGKFSWMYFVPSDTTPKESSPMKASSSQGAYRES